jgi:hypothetical protein
MKTVIGMVSLKHEEMKRSPATVIMYMTIHSEMEAVFGDSDYVHDDTFSEVEVVSSDSDYLHNVTFSEMETVSGDRIIYITRHFQKWKLKKYQKRS